MLTDQELQRLRNLGNEAEAAADEIERLRGLLELAATDIVRADMERAQIVAAERERCAKPMEEAAARLLAPKRTNEADRHVAEILQGHARRIRGA